MSIDNLHRRKRIYPFSKKIGSSSLDRQKSYQLIRRFKLSPPPPPPVVVPTPEYEVDYSLQNLINSDEGGYVSLPTSNLTLESLTSFSPDDETWAPGPDGSIDAALDTRVGNYAESIPVDFGIPVDIEDLAGTGSNIWTIAAIVLVDSELNPPPGAGSGEPFLPHFACIMEVGSTVSEDTGLVIGMSADDTAVAGTPDRSVQVVLRFDGTPSDVVLDTGPGSYSLGEWVGVAVTCEGTGLPVTLYVYKPFSSGNFISATEIMPATLVNTSERLSAPHHGPFAAGGQYYNEFYGLYRSWATWASALDQSQLKSWFDSYML